MKVAGQQPKPRRKKQKIEAAPAADASQGLKHSTPPPPSIAQQADGHVAAASAVDSNQQLRDQPAGAGQNVAALGVGPSAAALRAERTLRPPARDSSSAALAKHPLQTVSKQEAEPPGGPHTLVTTHQATVYLNTGGQQAKTVAAPSAMPPPGATGQGYSVQHAGPGPSAAGPASRGQQPSALAPTQAAGGGHPYSLSAAQPRRPPAMPADSQGGSMASDSAWGTEEERAQRKLQRQAEKLRMK